MKVLMLGWDFPPRVSGGLGTACRGLTRGLTKAGTEVLFVLPSGESREEENGLKFMSCDRVPILDEQRWPGSTARETLGVRVRLDPYRGRSFRVGDGRRDYFVELERYARAVGEIARVREFDVIHAHDWMSFPAGLFAREVSGKPLIAHVHSLECDREGSEADERVMAIERAGLETCDQIVSVSWTTARRAVECYDLDEHKVRVVHNAVADCPAKDDSCVATQSETVLFLGRLTGQKDPATFLRAAALVNAQLPRLRFVLAGDGDLLPAMVELAAALGLSACVRFTGFLGESDVRRMYRAASVFVMPSRSEPFGLVSLEAMSHGVPVIATRGSGVLETMTSALVVEPNDPEALAAQIVALATQPALRRELLESGAIEVRRASWESRGQQLSELYEELAG